MRTVKFDNDVCYFPQSAKQLKQLIIAYSIPCNVVKFLGKYTVIYSNKTCFNTPATRISDFTVKQWHDLLTKNMPECLKQGEQGILYTDMIKKVNNSTI